ncbi:MAG: phosphatase PAP2 family protein [Candidatus Nealsonbacteria bacterium]
MNWDIILFQKINQYAGQNQCLDSSAVFLAKYLGYILIFLLLFLLLKDFKKNLSVLIRIFGIALFSRFIVAELIRFLWERPRPFVEDNVNLLFDHQATASFPSGHATFFFALSAALYFYNKKAGIVFLIASSLISIARVFSGIHWPTDVIAGALIGLLLGWLGQKVFRSI